MLELIAGALVATAAVALVLEPLIRRGNGAQLAPSSDLDQLLELEESQSPKVKALLALREIEFDRATGKLSDEDYASLRERYARDALEAIRHEDEVGGASSSHSGADAAEMAILQYRSGKGGACATCGERPEPNAIFCSSCGRPLAKQSAPARCWMCGAELEGDAHYCGQCGFALSA